MQTDDGPTSDQAISQKTDLKKNKRDKSPIKDGQQTQSNVRQAEFNEQLTPDSSRSSSNSNKSFRINHQSDDNKNNIESNKAAVLDPFKN